MRVEFGRRLQFFAISNDSAGDFSSGPFSERDLLQTVRRGSQMAGRNLHSFLSRIIARMGGGTSAGLLQHQESGTVFGRTRSLKWSEDPPRASSSRNPVPDACSGGSGKSAGVAGRDPEGPAPAPRTPARGGRVARPPLRNMPLRSHGDCRSTVPSTSQATKERAGRGFGSVIHTLQSAVPVRSRGAGVT